MRSYNRTNNQIRPVTIEHDFQTGPTASLLIKMGNTHVLCAVHVEEKVPPFLKDTGKGWVTAEYGILPGATNSRMQREAAKGRSGRTYEIQRLIGRSLRMMVNLDDLGERTFRIDCDVLNADGGTRTASITGAALALYTALVKLADAGIMQMPEVTKIAAISAGIVDGEAKLDLDYIEDSNAGVDANFVLTEDNRIIEAQTTAEGDPMSRTQLNELLDLAEKGVSELLKLW
jgi:ribonuclease PH